MGMAFNGAKKPVSDPQNRLFGDGSIGGIAGGIGKILTFGPFVGMAQEGMNRRRAVEQNNMEYKSAMAAHAMDTPPPDVIRSMIAAGIDPKSPQGQAIITNNYSHPIVLGSAESGQQVINPAMMGGQQGGIDPAAIDMLKKNPALAPQFDEHFGPGSASRVLGGQ
ncbi:MAG TPA: hypothetical protein VL026_09440 [Rhizomicrobium sp.]|nr:hypothetical protein [Rhizomicrobium sp.]